MDQSKDKLWEVLDREYLGNEPWFTVRRDHVRLPNGNEILSYYVFEYPSWVNVIAITKDQKFLLVRQYRHGLRGYFMELCAGVCEEGEEPIVSARRELLEETGYGNGDWELLTAVSANGSSTNNITYCFLATNVEKISEQHLEPSEDITVHLLSLDEVRELLLSDEMKQATQLAPLWKYMAINKLM